MSYSYVKTVFPNFEYSNVYNDKLYSDMSGPAPTVTVPAVVEPNDENPAVSYLKSEPLIVRPEDQTHLLETKTFKEPFTQLKQHNEQNQENKEQDKYSDKDNLHFYNRRIETFNGHGHENGHGHGHEHDVYLKHVSKCDFCKSILRRQYPTEQMMELISYIALGIFILILLDRIKK